MSPPHFARESRAAFQARFEIPAPDGAWTGIVVRVARAESRMRQ
jgi:hypothetical protein